MNDSQKVCIIIPTYNQAAYIVKAVESAIAQDYATFTIVVADDNSTDKTTALLQSYIDNKKIIYKKNKENIGRVANYHKALYEYTDSDWVINLDGDDYFTNKSFISQAIKSINDAGEENVLFYQGSHIYKTNNYENENPPYIKSKDLILKSAGYFFDFFRNMHFSHMSTLYNRSLAIKSGFYEKDILSADIFSFLKFCLIFKDKKVIISKNISGVWVQHNANSGKTIHIKQHSDNFDLYKNLYQQALEMGYDKKRCLKWLLTARYKYLRTYTGLVSKKVFLK